MVSIETVSAPGRSQGEERAYMHKYRLHAEYRLYTHQLYIHTSSPPLLIFITHGLCYPRAFSYRYIMYTNHKPPSPLLYTPLYTLRCLLLCLLVQTLLSTGAHLLPYVPPKHKHSLIDAHFHDNASAPRDSIYPFKYTCHE